MYEAKYIQIEALRGLDSPNQKHHATRKFISHLIKIIAYIGILIIIAPSSAFSSLLCLDPPATSGLVLGATCGSVFVQIPRCCCSSQIPPILMNLANTKC